MENHSHSWYWVGLSVGSGVVGSIDWFVHASIPYLQFAALVISVAAGVRAWVAHNKRK